jgi:LAS superfamily LD-carboxypeptidase LdcB
LVHLAHASRLRPVVTSTFRSSAKQLQLYRDYLAGKPGLYSVAPPGRSLHEYGLAIDIWSPIPGALEALGEVWQQAGGVWGGAADPVHFSLWRSVDQLK